MILKATRLFGIVCGSFVLTHLMLCGGIATDASAPSSSAAQTRTEREFTIKIGQQLKIEGEDLQVRFVAVSEDSRCPADVNCVWAGNAAIALEIINGKCTTTLTLNTQRNSQSQEDGKAGPYRIRLVKLEPYPRSTEKISTADYKATLVVTKE